MRQGKYIDSEGTERWWKDGKHHRLDGPAYTDRNNTARWYKYGKLHRIGGPAYTRPDGIEIWWGDDYWWPAQEREWW